MFRHRRRHLWHFLAHRLPAGLVLVAYLVALFGVPVSASTGKDYRIPFPCQDHACGCRNAEECWRHCCCFSLEERLAWARAHGIQPPAYIGQSAEAEELGPHTCAHCDHREAAPKSCCAGHHESHAPATNRWGLSFCALRCQGLHSWWITTSILVPPPFRMTWTSPSVCTGWLADRDVTIPVMCLTPPEPPPRALVT